MNSTNAAEASLRGLGACCAVANVVLHILLIPGHLEEKFYIGVLFAVGSAVMLAVALALVIMKRPLAAWLTGALVSLGMIIGFLLSRTVGLPDGYHERSWDPPYGVLSLLVEGLFVIAFLAWLRDRAAHGTVSRAPHRAGNEPVSLGRGRAKRW
ncbi:hypothetical protein [Streptomyces chiangmaiensis]|uniref:Uncharacterized protein n=1 Tax=Streptomyces chiangmaiensis TaxID=766497 RepID=A0ABU7FRV3_9ACTN|nr:hypothetical protein [Streptomyces chiangmaiensis]MED7826835.1 hypothetical protein [Streptomyces chiangmaiensis]